MDISWLVCINSYVLGLLDLKISSWLHWFSSYVVSLRTQSTACWFEVSFIHTIDSTIWGRKLYSIFRFIRLAAAILPVSWLVARCHVAWRHWQVAVRRWSPWWRGQRIFSIDPPRQAAAEEQVSLHQNAGLLHPGRRVHISQFFNARMVPCSLIYQWIL